MYGNGTASAFEVKCIRYRRPASSGELERMGSEQSANLRALLEAANASLSAAVPIPLPGSPARLEEEAYANSESVRTTYSYANHLFEVATDNLSALSILVEEGISSITPYLCARGVLESCAVFCWLCAPDITVEGRVSRTFAFRYEGLVEQVKALRAANQPTDAAVERIATVNANAHGLGFPAIRDRRNRQVGLAERFPSGTEIVSAVLKQEANYRLFSAAVHGHFWALSKLGYVMTERQDPRGPIMTRSLPPLGAKLLAASAAPAYARATWLKVIRWGCDRNATAARLETCFDALGFASDNGIRFWRTDS